MRDIQPCIIVYRFTYNYYLYVYNSAFILQLLIEGTDANFP